MRSFLQKSACVILTFGLLLSLFGTRAANVSVSLEEALDSVSAYCFEKVSEPGYGSEWYLYCFAVAGYELPDAYQSTYEKALRAHVKACGGVLDARKYTEYARVVLALTALGRDPTAVAGYDLTRPLADFDATVRQGVNGAAFALLALDSDNYRIPAAGAGKTQATREKYVAYLVERQLADGGFSVSGKKSDPDMTAMALQALAKYTGRADVDGAVEKALAYLSKVQLASGGFENWGTENAESCTQVILALCELGIPLDDARFVKNGATLLDALLAYRNADGGFRHTPDGKSDMLASRQAYMALLSLSRVENGKTPFYTIGGSTTFRDLVGHPDRAAIEALARAGILSGRGDGTFDPDATMTRAEFAALVVRAVGAKPASANLFKDVPKDAWYAAYVGAAYENGIIKGVSETLFQPEATITDSEAEVMVARAARLMKIEPTTSEAWRASDVQITRGEVARMLYSLLASAGLM